MSSKFTVFAALFFIIVAIASVGLNQAQQLQPLPLADKASIELLTNGGFETDTNVDKLPDGWKASGNTLHKTDKLKCNKPDAPVAYSGNCAFMFRGNPNGTKSKLSQKLTDVTGIVDGSTMIYSAYLDPRNSKPGATFGTAKIVLNNQDKFKLTLSIPATNAVRGVGDYVQVSDGKTLNLAGAAVTKIKVKLLNDQTKGKFLVDDVSLSVMSASATATPTTQAASTATIPATSTTVISTGTATLEPSATDTDIPETATTEPTHTVENPSATPTLEVSATFTDTPLDTPTETATPPPTSMPTNTEVPPTNTTTSTPTNTPSNTPTNTPVGTPSMLVAPDGAINDRFGRGVSLYGNTVVIGAANDDSMRGAAYVFTRSGATWTQQKKLIASDGAASSYFGWSTAIYGDVAVIGAFGADGGMGAAYVFTRTGNIWTEQQKLTPWDGAAGDNFGISVAINENNAIAIGAWQHNGDRGAVYTFLPTADGWAPFQKLTASDAAVNDWLGYSVAMSGTTIISGAYNKANGQGAVYVFDWHNGSWGQQQKLTARDAIDNDFFGYAVDIAGDTAVIGAYGRDGSRGRAYVFTRTGSNWTEQQKLIVNDNLPNDFAGSAVAISGNTVIIGAYGKMNFQGSGYVFRRSGTTWTQIQKLIRSNGSSGDNLGQSVDIDGIYIILGAFLDDVGANENQGSAWSYLVP